MQNAHDLENHMVIPQTPIASNESDSSPHPVPTSEDFDDLSFQELMEACDFSEKLSAEFAFEFIHESMAREAGKERDEYMAYRHSVFAEMAATKARLS